MPRRSKVFRGYSLHHWHAHGAFGSLPVETPGSALASDGGGALFGGALRVVEQLCVADWRMTRRQVGTSGTTIAEVWRRRAGAWTQLATLTIPQVMGPFAEAVAAPSSGQDPLAILEVGDVVVARLVSAETGNPRDLSVALETR